MNNIDLHYKLAAEECAKYILNSDSEQTDYQDFIQQGNDPRDHILYSASIILDDADQFQVDIEEYNKINKEFAKWEK
jgi:hypothetical protein